MTNYLDNHLSNMVISVQQFDQYQRFLVVVAKLNNSMTYTSHSVEDLNKKCAIIIVNVEDHDGVVLFVCLFLPT